jgi:predicted tellurium resistance membrane protein TerC/CBS domain-containing protein
MAWMGDATAWLGLGTLVLMEIVLGIDNLIFIAILSDRLPPQQRDRARMVGLALALVGRLALLSGISWLQTLKAPLIDIAGISLSTRDLVLVLGGLFLLFKATVELHHRLEGAETAQQGGPSGAAAFWQVIAQIVALDIVFSLDSVITAVGMVDALEVMMIAVVVAVVIMIWASRPLMDFVSAHPTVVVLCLSFLLMIGFSLVLDGFGFHLPKGYLYAAMGFSVAVETLNQVSHRNQARRAASGDLRARAASAILRILGGPPTALPADAVASLVAASGASDVFAPQERRMLRRVLGLSDQSARSIMTESDQVVWLDLEHSAASLRQTILDSGHAAYPVRQEGALLGVARAPHLMRDLLEAGRIDPATLESRPVTVSEDRSVVDTIELIRRAIVQIAIVTDGSGAIRGVVSPTDILRAIVGERAGDRENDSPDAPARTDSRHG